MSTEKLAQWQPQEKPNEAMCKRLREIIVEIVYAKWAQDQKPSTLISIFYRVTDRIGKERQKGNWPREWKQPGKRTIDRRVNEAAARIFYKEGKVKIIAVTAGVYMPNPELFDPPLKIPEVKE